MKLENMLEALVASAAFAAIGLVVFAIAFWLMTNQNTALGIIMAGVIIGVSLIIAAAIHG
jgi:uncharacterized membrane protein YjfL (UPF0719 family)